MGGEHHNFRFERRVNVSVGFILWSVREIIEDCLTEREKSMKQLFLSALITLPALAYAGDCWIIEDIGGQKTQTSEVYSNHPFSPADKTPQSKRLSGSTRLATVQSGHASALGFLETEIPVMYP
jgi:hypothetical protein